MSEPQTPPASLIQDDSTSDLIDMQAVFDEEEGIPRRSPSCYPFSLLFRAR